MTLNLWLATLHPLAQALGIAFGALASGSPAATLTGAIVRAAGIGLHDFPAGLHVRVCGDDVPRCGAG